MYFLGAITCPSGAYNNQQTGASGIGVFNIPPGARAFYLQASHTGVSFELMVATGLTSPSGYQTTKARAGFLNAPGSNQPPLSGPFRSLWGPDKYTVVAVYNQGDVASFVSVKVYATPTA